MLGSDVATRAYCSRRPDCAAARTRARATAEARILQETRADVALAVRLRVGTFREQPALEHRSVIRLTTCEGSTTLRACHSLVSDLDVVDAARFRPIVGRIEPIDSANVLQRADGDASQVHRPGLGGVETVKRAVRAAVAIRVGSVLPCVIDSSIVIPVVPGSQDCSQAMFAIDGNDPTPLYAQLERAIRVAIATGRLNVGDKLPTVRQLAVDLKINANTVAKVYGELERSGVLETRRGVGTFIRQDGVAWFLPAGSRAAARGAGGSLPGRCRHPGVLGG